ncbi:prolyl-tRNA editing enzyme YbaK/EbsC (Cys-tRNA(Pro) deacylase) [Mumia flava]|uniref:Prolyl-tRNA editing enzyme YbaK/EbsC (Cys-tRNA(Pro) deacylase) n=1 Tax=Mumia flava TaxID=1348852 RepID=A0A0B2BUB7_9ACTN|nr:YbaK/EbsC family protein [Mumia flava]PJJ56040.1 prolyl-tRNA editing enzyme YbaK/EbsC (Cys-tRNA(Pro) deacylase) [Mumia flava]
MPPRVRRVVDVLAAHGQDSDVRFLPESVRTAAAAADALDVEVGAIANSLVFDAGGSPVLVLTSGAHRVDVAALAAAWDLPPLRRASPDFVRDHTGQPIGGVAPVGHPEALRTYVDVALADHDVVWAAAGHPQSVFATSFDGLVRLTGGTPTIVTGA